MPVTGLAGCCPVVPLDTVKAPVDVKAESAVAVSVGTVRAPLTVPPVLALRMETAVAVLKTRLTPEANDTSALALEDSRTTVLVKVPVPTVP